MSNSATSKLAIAPRPSSISRSSVEQMKKNLKRLEALIRSPYVRQADFATRDRLARRLHEIKDT